MADYNLSVQDIAAAIQVIDIASQRGTWKGDELSKVGNLRDKYANFLEQVTKEKHDPDVPDEAQQPTESESKPTNKKAE